MLEVRLTEILRRMMPSSEMGVPLLLYRPRQPRPCLSEGGEAEVGGKRHRAAEEQPPAVQLLRQKRGWGLPASVKNCF